MEVCTNSLRLAEHDLLKLVAVNRAVLVEVKLVNHSLPGSVEAHTARHR